MTISFPVGEVVCDKNRPVALVDSGYNIITSADAKKQIFHLTPDNINEINSTKAFSYYKDSINSSGVLTLIDSSLTGVIDANLLVTILKVESDGDPRETSVAESTASGIAQFIKSTADSIGIIDSYNYADTIVGLVNLANKNGLEIKNQLPGISTNDLKVFIFAAHNIGVGGSDNPLKPRYLADKYQVKSAYCIKAIQIYRQLTSITLTLPG